MFGSVLFEHIRGIKVQVLISRSIGACCTGIHLYLGAAHEGGYLFTSRHPISGPGTFYKMRRILNPF